MHDLQHPAQNTGNITSIKSLGLATGAGRELVCSPPVHARNTHQCKCQLQLHQCRGAAHCLHKDIVTCLVWTWRDCLGLGHNYCTHDDMTQISQTLIYSHSLQYKLGRSCMSTYVVLNCLNNVLNLQEMSIFTSSDVIRTKKSPNCGLCCSMLRMLEFFRKFARNLFVLVDVQLHAQPAQASTQHIVIC